VEELPITGWEVGENQENLPKTGKKRTGRGKKEDPQKIIPEGTDFPKGFCPREPGKKKNEKAGRMAAQQKQVTLEEEYSADSTKLSEPLKGKKTGERGKLDRKN